LLFYKSLAFFAENSKRGILKLTKEMKSDILSRMWKTLERVGSIGLHLRKRELLFRLEV
jgi:hypothetical protein